MYFKKFDEHVEMYLDVKDKQGITPICEKGCNTCCKKLTLIASKIEIELIVKKLNNMNKNLKKIIKGNIQKLDKKYKGDGIKSQKITNSSQLNNVIMIYPCPFLIGNNCSIYEVRPKICRRYFSSDFTLCEEGKEGNLTMPFNENLHVEYQKDYPENFKDGAEKIGHVHRCIDYSDGKFVALL